MKNHIDTYQEMLMAEASKYSDGIFLTLNALTNDVFKFEEQLIQAMHWLNCYCFGRAYRNNKKRLRIFGVVEKGELNKKLHIHLIIMYNQDLRRSIQELNNFIRIKWHRLLKARGSVFGTLVNVQHINVVETRISYSLKTFINKNNLSNLHFF